MADSKPYSDPWYRIDDFLYGGSVSIDLDSNGTDDFTFTSDQVSKGDVWEKHSLTVSILDSDWSVMYYTTTDTVCVDTFHMTDSTYKLTYHLCDPDTLGPQDSIIERNLILVHMLDSTDLYTFDYNSASLLFQDSLAYLSHYDYQEEGYIRPEDPPFSANKVYGYLIFKSDVGKLKAVEVSHTYREPDIENNPPQYLISKEVISLN